MAATPRTVSSELDLSQPSNRRAVGTLSPNRAMPAGTHTEEADHELVSLAGVPPPADERAIHNVLSSPSLPVPSATRAREDQCGRDFLVPPVLTSAPYTTAAAGEISLPARLLSAADLGIVGTHQPPVGGHTAGEGHGPDVTHDHDALARLIAEIRETHRLRQDMLRAETALTLRIKAQARRLGQDQRLCDIQDDRVLSESPNGDGQSSNDIPPATAVSCDFDDEGHRRFDAHEQDALILQVASQPFVDARALIHRERLKYERTMGKLARLLPAYSWVALVRGFGDVGFAQIVGECGDLSNYSNPAKVWKRMGLAVIDGGRQRRVAGAEALDHGYAPYRRSLMWNIGDSLIKGNRDGAYRTYYLAEKERQREKLGPDVAQAWVHNRAQRHMEKRLLKHLWQAWNRFPVGES